MGFPDARPRPPPRTVRSRSRRSMNGKLGSPLCSSPTQEEKLLSRHCELQPSDAPPRFCCRRRRRFHGGLKPQTGSAPFGPFQASTDEAPPGPWGVERKLLARRYSSPVPRRKFFPVDPTEIARLRLAGAWLRCAVRAAQLRTRCGAPQKTTEGFPRPIEIWNNIPCCRGRLVSWCLARHRGAMGCRTQTVGQALFTPNAATNAVFRCAD